jgi:hypothetical protein
MFYLAVSHLCIRQKEKEVEERLARVYQELSEARHDQRECDQQTRLRDAIETMKRIYTGVHGRLIDLCHPVQKKYETAISVVLGKTLDAIVVEDSKTAIECIQVSFFECPEKRNVCIAIDVEMGCTHSYSYWFSTLKSNALA